MNLGRGQSRGYVNWAEPDSRGKARRTPYESSISGPSMLCNWATYMITRLWTADYKIGNGVTVNLNIIAEKGTINITD